VAKRVRNGATRYSLSCNPDITLDLLAKRHSTAADFIFVGQVNSELPFMPGEGDLDANAFDLVLDSQQTDFPLLAPPREPIDLIEYAAGLRVAGIVADGGTLQLGIGAFGDAVAQSLILRHHKNASFRDLLERLSFTATAPAGMIEHKPLEVGLHGTSEMFVEGFLELFHAGILRREVDGVLLHAAFFLGSRAFYRALRELPEVQLEKFRMTAASYVNKIYGDEAAKRCARVKARFVNGAMMATLLGAIVSDGLENGQVVSGVGGQYNFIAQGFALQDARSIIMVRATRTANWRTSSNRMLKYAATTTAYNATGTPGASRRASPWRRPLRQAWRAGGILGTPWMMCPSSRRPVGCPMIQMASARARNRSKHAEPHGSLIGSALALRHTKYANC
jgi:hypothetical protein